MCVKLVSVYSPPITQYAMVASRHRECAARIAEPAEGCNRGPSGARPRSHRHEEEAMIDETDLRHLRRCVALAREALEDRKRTRLNSSHSCAARMPSSA